MPEYREPVTKYHCHHCGKEYERWFETSDEGVVSCPSCNSPDVERLYFHPLVKVEGMGPINKYHCRHCGQEFERRFEASDEGVVTCPFCKSPDVWRGNLSSLVKSEKS
jgi:putative FmdB family regulatory protein